MEDKQIAISYTYDELDRLSSVTYGVENTVHYSYDEAGNLVTVNAYTNLRDEVSPGEALATVPAGDKEDRDEQPSDSAADHPEDRSPSWHLNRGGESFGPYTWEEMLSFAADGLIRPEDLVWNSSMTEWAKARDVTGLIIDA